ELPVGSRLTVLGGIRVDHHRAHGAIVSPRAALKWSAGDWTTFRLNLATGFRVVHLFTEDHAALSGSREVVVAEELAPERSSTVTASMRTMLGIGSLPVYLDVDVFHTGFSNRILPDYDSEPGRIIYRNLRGVAITRGASLGLSLDPASAPVGFRAGATLQRVTRTDLGLTSEVEFAPRFKGDFGVTWNASEAVAVDWTGSVTGRMALPELGGVTEHSPWFTEQHLQVTTELAPSRYLTVGIRNLFDTRQRNPLVAPHDPFGPDFDTYRVWGPVQGRRLLVAMQWNAR
ncbi:MAG TPA: TonB-dependent receptor, partial [Gemmatimonadales bacterium]|nr:TonB-dependent receptor [Gemmatimonadales bacterium]